MTIETLTEDELRCIAAENSSLWDKVLCIIDAQATQLQARIKELLDETFALLTRAEEAEAERDAAENELRRLGHGVEVIDVITETGNRFTSHVGDSSWDTADNRARVRVHHDATESELAEVSAVLD
jgi:hypothetical protein